MKLSQIMNRCKFMKGYSIAILDMNLSEIDNVDDINKIYMYALTIIKKMPDKSMMMILDIRGLSEGDKIKSKLQSMIIECGQHFKKSAVIVDEKSEKMMKSIINNLGLKKVTLFTDREIALEKIIA